VKDPILNALCAVTCTSSRRKCICYVEQQTDLGIGHLIVEVSRSQIIRQKHTHTVGLLLTKDHLFGAAAVNTTHKEHKNDRHRSPQRDFFKRIFYLFILSLHTVLLDKLFRGSKC